MRRLVVLLCAELVGAGFLGAGRGEAQTAEKPRLLPRDREIALALSAAPEAIAQAATVYVLTPRGYEKAREGSNGFSCLVERDHPASLQPICYDPEGTATILPRSLRVGQLQMQGLDAAAIQRDIAEGFRTGRYRAARRVGVAYMLSPAMRFYNPETGRLEPERPHLMVYAPYLTSADIGLSPAGHGKRTGLPLVANEGQPNAYLIFFVR